VDVRTEILLLTEGGGAQRVAFESVDERVPRELELELEEFMLDCMSGKVSETVMELTVRSRVVCLLGTRSVGC
jgi:hypothetical protein